MGRECLDTLDVVYRESRIRPDQRLSTATTGSFRLVRHAGHS